MHGDAIGGSGLSFAGAFLDDLGFEAGSGFFGIGRSGGDVGGSLEWVIFILAAAEKSGAKQGEADGEADDYYRYSLGELINNWRGEPWYGANKYFIANETARFPVNQVFRDLRYNADVYSDYNTSL